MFEKKNGKRFLASVMALVMLLSLAPVGALAADETTEESPAVAQPADESNPKPVGTDEQNTENTNEETTPPPRNEGGAGTTVDNNDTSAAISEMPVIMNPVDLLNQASDYTTELTWSPSSSSIEEATFFYLKTPASIPGSNETEDWGSALGNGTVNTSDLWWTETNLDGSYGHKVENSFNVTNSMINNWPSDPGEYDSEKGGYVLNKNNSHWNTIFNAYKENVEQQLGVKDLSSSDVTDIILTPFKVSRYNKTTTDKHYHVDCTVTVKCDKFATATFKLWNDETRTYKIYSAANYRKGTSVVFPPVETKPEYTFSGWYLNEELTGSALDEHTIEKNVTFYAKYTPKTYTVTFNSMGGSSVNPQNVEHGTKADEPSAPTKEGYEFQGWYTGEDATASVYDFDTAVTQDITLYAIWKAKEESNPNPPTDTVDAKYFVLMPSANAPSSGKNQGQENYFPSERTENGKTIKDDGGVEGASRATGYAGKITQVAADLVKNKGDGGYFKATGVEDAYLAQKPTNLGYFDASNYNKEGTTWTYAGHGDLPATLTAFTMEGKEVVWYVIKNVGTETKPDYHVDGYVKGVDIEVNYHQNFTEGTSWTQTGLKSGNTVKIKDYATVWPNSSRAGYTFTGWNTKADGTGDSYAANSNADLKTSMDLFAQWEKDVWTDADAKDTPSAEDKDSKDKGDGIPDSQQILIEYKAYKEGNGTVEPGFEVITVKKDGTLTPTKGSTANAETGYVFVTWSDKNAVVNETTVDSIVSSAAATTKTAKWTPNLTASDKGKTYTYTAIFLEDKVGDKNEDGTDKGDGIPDAWQYKVTFKVVNGKWNDHDNSDNIVVYVNAKDKDGKTLESKLTEAQIPAVGEKPNSGYRASGSWDKSLSADLKITGDTEFTFTYSRRSSGGSSRPSTPTVTIPDDVPTGLNGKDHYAYIIGYGNNDVRPQNNITRAEVATIFFRLLTDETREANMTKSNSYNDVKDGDWFCCAVSTLSKMGIIKGYEDGSFKPNDPISRAEFAAIAARFDPDGDKTPATFADVTSHWAKDEISIAANHGWIKGYEDGSFKPDQKITRAETMTLVNRVLNRLPETKDDLHKDMKTWVDNMDETAWYYLAVQEATNSHYFKNKTGTKFEQWTDLRDTRDWSELEK